MSNTVEIILFVAGIIMFLALLLAFIRFIVGPTLVDRTIAFDVLTVGSLGLMALFSFVAERLIYLDVSIIYGLLSFIAVVVVGKYIEKSL
jgi:multicomponent Na+:H+ antiporter subunit F